MIERSPQDIRSAPRKCWPGPRHLSFERLSQAFSRLLRWPRPPSATTLWRWETGKGKPTEKADQNLVPNLIRVYALLAAEDKVDLGETLKDLAMHYSLQDIDLSLPAPPLTHDSPALPDADKLKFGLIAQPDAAIFASIVEQEMGGTEYVQALGPDAYPKIPELLMKNEIQVAIMGAEALRKHALYGLLDESSPFVYQPLMRLRGNAILVAAATGWTTFGQHLAATATEGTGRAARDRRLCDALARTLLQFPGRKVGVEDIFLPRQSARRRMAMAELFKIALSAPCLQPAERQALADFAEALMPRPAFLPGPASSEGSADGTGAAASVRFLKRLGQASDDERGRIVLPAGLTYRLAAEDHGAAPLIDSDELQSLATLRPPHLLNADRGYLSRLLFPVNVAVWTKGTDQRCREALNRLRGRWNEHVVALRDRPTPMLDRLSASVDRFMRQALATQHDLSPEESDDVWPVNQGPGEEQLRRLVNEQLIEFFFWPRFARG